MAEARNTPGTEQLHTLPTKPNEPYVLQSLTIWAPASGQRPAIHHETATTNNDQTRVLETMHHYKTWGDER